MRKIALVLMLAGALAGGCQKGSGPRVAGGATTAPSTHGIAEMSDEELQVVLSTLARAHEQKMQLALFVNLGMLPVGPAFKGYYGTMRSEQAGLLSELRTFAKGQGIDLKFRFPDNTDGRALKIMEARQEKLVRADAREDFERDMLMNMYQDYEWQISNLQALLPRVKDAKLKEYVERSLKVQEAGSAESLRLLRKYKFAS